MRTTSASNSIHEQSDGNSNGVGAAPASQLDPEFVDVPGLQILFGIKRSLAYQLLADGAIKGVSLRRRNQIRGKRLFSVDSVRAFLHAQMEDGR